MLALLLSLLLPLVLLDAPLLAAGERSGKGGGAPSRPSPSKKERVVHHHYRHTVLPGETLGEIARRYAVPITALQRWNDLPGHFLREGQVLHVYTPHPVRSRRELTHRVVRGETLGKIARRYEVDPAELARLNRITDPHRLREGQLLRVVVEGPEQPSVSKGTPQAGKLIHGEQLLPGPGYRVRARSRAWGTNATVTRLIAAFRKMERRFPGARVVIGDLSLKEGGHMPPHVSHQNGRDVDISFYVKGKKALEDWVRVTPATLDAQRTLALIEELIAGGGVQYVFISYPLQAPLYEQAKKAGWSARKLRQVFQYPRGEAAVAIVMHEPGHNDHFHLRFED